MAEDYAIKKEAKLVALAVANRILEDAVGHVKDSQKDAYNDLLTITRRLVDTIDEDDIKGITTSEKKALMAICYMIMERTHG